MKGGASLGLAACFLSIAYVVDAREATPAKSLRVPDGFRVELVRSAQAGEGSWISMCFDGRGRLILARDRRGLIRLTLAGKSSPAKVEVLDDTLRHCRGVLHAHGHLWAQATDSRGFYRLTDTNGDDRFDEIKRIKPLAYESRYGHGGNQLKLGPDGAIWLVVGNDVGLIEGTAEDSPYRDPRDDHLIPDPRDRVEEVRVGRIYRFDPRTDQWLCFAGGFRNQVDIAFDAEGELFTFDADMEWDIGAPWYRPVRVNHVVSGGEYGWRWASGKWPAYLPDSLPSTFDYGLGSPTGLEFGTQSSFPSTYRDSLFLGEWQNGRILRAKLSPRGASFACEVESFIEGGPLNVADLCFGPDGALWFITGGRQSQSGLYRVTYDGAPRETPRKSQSELDTSEASRARRALRRRLERLHRGPTKDSREPALVEAWAALDSDDPWLRFAARLAIERQPLASWRERALSESRTTASLFGLIALARVGERMDQARVRARLLEHDLAKLERSDLLAALRVYQLSFSRHGAPSDEERRRVLEQVDALFPHSSSPVNRELSTLLVYLRAPRIVERGVSLLTVTAAQEEQVFLAKLITREPLGWSLESRKSLLDWLTRASGFRGGRLLTRSVAHIRDDFLSQISSEDRAALARELDALQRSFASKSASAPQRRFVKKWTVEELRPALEKSGLVGKGGSFESGLRAFHGAGCARCHRFGDEGTAIGPDLTNVGRRFDAVALLESIVEPSKVVDEKYRPVTYVLENGQVVTGLATQVSGKHLVVQPQLLEGKSVQVERAKIIRSTPSAVSPMPSGLLDVLERQEILDLVAFLRGDIVP